MPTLIREVAVLGATSYGAALATHLACAGLSVAFVEEAGQDAEARLHAALNADRTRDFLLDPKARLRIRTGVVGDARILGACEWLCDMGVGTLAARQARLATLFAVLPPTTLVSGGRSLYTARDLAQPLGAEQRARFSITRIFAPVARMRLVELTHAGADHNNLERLIDLSRLRLGKDIQTAPDHFGGLAVRFGLHALLNAIQAAKEAGFEPLIADRYAGRAAGRSARSIFGCLDWYGHEACLADLALLSESLRDDPFRISFAPAPLKALLAAHPDPYFYPPKESGTELAFVPARLPIEAESQLRKIEALPDPGARVAAMLQAPDPVGGFVWRLWRDTFLYAAYLALALDEPPAAIDRAMRWGYGWEIGPFELWDALGVKPVTARLIADGCEVPEALRRVLSMPKPAWYLDVRGNKTHFFARASRYEDVPVTPSDIPLAPLIRATDEVSQHGHLRLLDLGHGVGCLVTNSATGFVIDDEFLDFIHHAFDSWSARGLGGLVLFSQGRDFSARGLDYCRLLDQCERGDFAAIEAECRARQELMQRLAQSAFPIVAALGGRAFDAGLELAMHASCMQVHIEAQPGFVAARAGLLPSCGGLKELLLRLDEHQRHNGPSAATFAACLRLLEPVVYANAFAARSEGILRRGDHLTMGRAHLLYEARELLSRLLDNGFARPKPPALHLAGPGSAIVMLERLRQRIEAGFLPEDDLPLAVQLARVYSGGDTGPERPISEERLLDLEREAFVALCRDASCPKRLRILCERTESC